MMLLASSMTSLRAFSPTFRMRTLGFCSLMNIFSKVWKTFFWNSRRQYFSSPQLERFLSTSGSACRQMTTSGSTSPLSGAEHHSQLMPFAQEQATPEYQQRSQIMLIPDANKFSILVRFSQRLAEKRRWMVSLLISDLLERQSLIMRPMEDVRSGKFISTACSSRSSRYLRTELVTDDLPERSNPSSTISLPRFMI